MREQGAKPRALFLFPDEPPQSDAEVCSGRYRNWLEGEACPYSEDGRIPWPEEGEARGGQTAAVAQQRGRPGGEPASQEPGPEAGVVADEGGRQGIPCVLAQLGRLSDWRGERGLEFPPELGAQTLLKCKQMFLLVLSPGWEAGR